MTTPSREDIAHTLQRTRQRTQLLTEALDEPDLVRQHSPIMSPLVWDLTHIGNQEELWLLRDVGGRDPVMDPALDEMYDAFQHPRSERPALPLLSVNESRTYVVDVRDKVFDVLDTVPLRGASVGG